MRVKIIIEPRKREFEIPINYNYPLGSALYRLFFESSPEFSRWLHDEGFVSRDGKKMKLFTFSKLFISKAEVSNESIKGSGRCWFLFSSPFDFSIVTSLIEGIINRRKLVIANRVVGSEFRIKSIEKVAEPVFNEEMDYLMLSPTVASTMVEKDGKLVEHYYRADENGVEENLAINLKKKYEIVNKEEYRGKLKIALDKEYIKRKGGAEKISKLITVLEGREGETRVKGFVCPVKIKGEAKIQRIGYECGIGRKNSIGFGMLEVVNQV